MLTSKKFAMVTAVDTSVLLDVVADDPQWADASEAALRQASQEGSLLIGECVLAEITPALGAEAVEEFLDDWNIRFLPSSRTTHYLPEKCLPCTSRGAAKSAVCCRTF